MIVLIGIQILITGCSQGNRSVLPIPVPVVSPSSPILSENSKALFTKYNWTLIQEVAKYSIDLPASFEHAPGDFPAIIYWAYNNELNKAIGLNLEPYLGKTVVAIIYSLKNEEPGYCTFPPEQTRGIIVQYEGEIVGAWIDQGRHNGFACSLNRKSFDEITQQTWEAWLVSSGVVNVTNELDNKLATMSPEELITFYYEAIDHQDYTSAYAVFSRGELVKYLFRNMADSTLYNSSFADESHGGQWGILNISSARLVNLESFLSTSYQVTVDLKFKQPDPTMPYDGTYSWFIEITKEIEMLGWRIKSFGNG